ncbi:MAG: hypothetical protein KJ620_00950, partial [Candidatus Edwardsbacteria bacterium]|nr:hypothetical protein [Candidatus Edwardsbacteria bacterium]MBU1577578.1 hypothetical protein [Candidatus Edwardsbacteria bacterium]MBU2463962.1 hypothetical protein [Candidatus Edwardsbacteria bacterium]
MSVLEITECKEFIIQANSLATQKGLLLILNKYSEQQNNPASNAIRSWYQNMVDGKSYQDAIEGMSLRFPPSIEQVLIKSIENSCLDYALADLSDIFMLTETDDELIEGLGRLVDKYMNGMNSEIICEDCLIREMEKILRRAYLEE